MSQIYSLNGYNLKDVTAREKIQELEQGIVKGVQVAGVDLSKDDDGKVNIPKASASVNGVVKVGSSSLGLATNSNNVLYTLSAGNDDISARTNAYKPITAYNLNSSVKAALTDAKRIGHNGDSELTQSEKKNARQIIGAANEQEAKKQSKIINILNNASNGHVYDKQADSTEAYQKVVPTNSVGYSVVNEIGGKTVVQDGQLVSAYVQKVRSESKNLLWLTRKGESFTQCGLDITISDDGSTITMNGTTTATVRLCLWGDTNYSTSAFPFETGYYTYSVNAVSGTGSIPSLYLNGASLGGGGTRIVENGQLNTRLQIMSGVTCNNRVVQLMLERGSTVTDYVPHFHEDYSIPSAVRTSYPIRSAGSVHDSYEWDGEKWWHVKRVGKYTFNGSENWLIDSANNIKNYINSNSFYGMAKSDNYIGKMLCDRYATKASHLDGGYGISAYYDSSYQYANQNWFYASIEGLSTREQYQSALSGATVYYELATPIRTDITSLMNWDAMMDVEADGTVTFVQDGTSLNTPSTVTHYIGVDAIRGVQVAGTDLIQDADGKVNIPTANATTTGVCRIPTSGYAQGIMPWVSGGVPYVSIDQAAISNITNRDGGKRPIVPSLLNASVKAALTDSNRIGQNDDALTGEERGNACDVIGAQRKLADGWVLKGTLNTDNKATGVSVDLSGCTEVIVSGTVKATSDGFISTNLGTFSIATINGSRTIMVYAADSFLGYDVIIGKYRDEANALRVDKNLTQAYSYINGNKISEISQFKWNSSSAVTSCDIKIYAR